MWMHFNDQTANLIAEKLSEQGHTVNMMVTGDNRITRMSIVNADGMSGSNLVPGNWIKILNFKEENVSGYQISNSIPPDVTDMQLDRCKTLAEVIQTGVGAASMCWKSVDKAGVFDSTRAKDVSDQIYNAAQKFLCPEHPSEPVPLKQPSRVTSADDFEKMLKQQAFWYSEWLDSQGLLVEEAASGDARSHMNLVEDFLAADADRSEEKVDEWMPTNSELIKMAKDSHGGYVAASASADAFREGLCEALGYTMGPGGDRPADEQLIKAAAMAIRNGPSSFGGSEVPGATRLGGQV